MGRHKDRNTNLKTFQSNTSNMPQFNHTTSKKSYAQTSSNPALLNDHTLSQTQLNPFATASDIGQAEPISINIPTNSVVLSGHYDAYN